VVKPGGWLAVIWNRTADDHSGIRRAVDAVYAELVPALSPHGALTAGQPPVGSPPPGVGVGEGTWKVFPWARSFTTSQWIELVQTQSDHRLLEAGQRQALLRRLAEVIDEHGGVYHHPYNCWLWTAPRLP
jgi:hypothetical protein